MNNYMIRGNEFLTEYENRVIIFDIVERNGNELTLMSRDILCFEPFDVKGSNDYSRSSLKRFLNDEFKQRFNKRFLDKLQGEFFLPSEEEIRKWFSTAENRIKYYKGRLYCYCVRTPSSNDLYYSRCIDTYGHTSCFNMHDAYGIAPACKIIL